MASDWLCCQPIRCHIWKSLSTISMWNFLSNPGSRKIKILFMIELMLVIDMTILSTLYDRNENIQSVTLMQCGERKKKIYQTVQTVTLEQNGHHFADSISLQWCHNGRHDLSNHQPHHCLLNRLFRRRSKKTSKLCVTGLCAGYSPGTGEFPAQMASNAENVSIWWRRHVLIYFPVRKCFMFIHISLKFVPKGPTDKKINKILASDQHWNVFVLKQEETISWTNDDPVHQYIIFLFLFVKINKKLLMWQ